MWTWIFRRRRVADDEERVAEPVQLRLERLRVEPLAFDHEDGAVTVFGELLVDGVEARRVGVLRRRVRNRLAGEGGGDAADDLEQPGPARVDDSGLPQDLELVGRARERVLTALDQLLQERRGLERRVAWILGFSASSRITDSIVPSTGRRTAR